MRLLLTVFLLTLSAVDCNNFDKAAADVISMFDAIMDFPQYLGKAGRSQELLSAFSEKILPLAEEFAVLLDKGERQKTPIENVTRHIQKKMDGLRIPNTFVSDININIRLILSHIAFAQAKLGGENTPYYVRKMCLEEHGSVEMAMDNYLGISCQQTAFSPITSSILNSIINSFKFTKSLSTNRDIITTSQQDKFNAYYSGLYFHLENTKNIDRDKYKLSEFIDEKKGVVYETKLKLFEDLLRLFRLNKYHLPESKCAPLSVFVESHFNRDKLLRFHNVIMKQLYATTYIERMCANISSFGNPTGAEMYASTASERLKPVLSVLDGCFDSLLESTWPTTENELVREYMIEASGGSNVAENTTEYQGIADFVHDKIKSIGHPRYYQHFFISKEYQVGSDNFDYNCKDDTCSRAVSDGIQCLTLRGKKANVDKKLQRFETFTQSIKPKVMDVLEQNYPSATEIVTKLRDDHNINLNTFVNHSSYILLYKSQYFGDCKIDYGHKSEEEQYSSYHRTFSYRNNDTMFSRCHDWLLFVGM